MLLTGKGSPGTLSGLTQKKGRVVMMIALVQRGADYSDDTA